MKSEKFQFIEKLGSWKYREAYIWASINTNLPSQIRALRLRQGMKQKDLADASKMLQPRISAMEKPGAVKFNIETLVRVAAGLRVGLIVKFVPISEMVEWENEFSQDEFNVVTFDRDTKLLSGATRVDADHYCSESSTPKWFYLETPKPMRALSEAGHGIPVGPVLLETDSASTGQSFQVY